MALQDYEKVERVEPASESDDDDNDEEDEVTLPRTSEEVRRHDMETLTAEEEAERLLTGSSSRGDRTKGRRDGERRGQRRRNKKRDGKNRTEKEVMFRLEEGASQRDSSQDSTELDMQLLGSARRKRKSRCARCCRFALIYLVTIAAFLALLYGAWRASASSRSSANPSTTPQTLSNGTHTFAPTTILISLDGFRADFLHRNLTPALSAFIRDGVSPKYMMPSFPSVTFPNHFTLVTGKYPEAHGIVGNSFWDPQVQKEFYYVDPERSMQPEWWTAEPLWETAELAGVRSAIHMWPGSEAHIGKLEPAYVDKFDMDEPLANKVARMLGWLDLPGPNDTDARDEQPRPQLIAAYVPDVDSDGHQYGPNSTYIRSTIRETDGMLGALFEGIHARNLTEVVNIVVVSDHGMASTDVDRLIQLEDLLDPSLIEHTDGWPLYGLRPHDPSPEHLQQLYDSIHAKSQLAQYKGAFEVYLRDINMPDRYHFSHNPRIAPLWIVPTAGWAVVTKAEFDIPAGKAQGHVYNPRGLHGYDHEHPLMRAIFVARGPAFPHVKGSKVAPFQNTEVYNIICDSLGLRPVPNNGTLRLPLTTEGVHDFEAYAGADLPGDFAEQDSGPDDVILPPMVPNLNNHLADPADPFAVAEPDVSMPEAAAAEDSTAPDRPEIQDKSSDATGQGAVDRWMKWMQGKLDAIKNWSASVLGGAKGDDEEED